MVYLLQSHPQPPTNADGVSCFLEDGVNSDVRCQLSQNEMLQNGVAAADEVDYTANGLSYLAYYLSDKE